MNALTDLAVPDIGDFAEVPVIELHVQPGDAVAIDDPLVTLESDKATMEVPATVAGIIREVLVKPGDKVSEGSLLARLEAGATATEASAAPRNGQDKPDAVLQIPPPPQTSAALSPPPPPSLPPLGSRIHASPAVRAYARELGVDLARVPPSGANGRILREDVTIWVKGTLTQAVPADAGNTSGAGLDILPWPQVDFARFGAIEPLPLSRIQKISARNLARNWVMIPAVTYHEEADITDLEAFRLQINRENAKNGGVAKLTLLAFLIKVCVRALQRFPVFNASLAGETLVLKKYIHIGFAADTPNGLVVPVVKNADRMRVLEIAAETTRLAQEAREGRLKPADMQGASFTISSLGGIGGTAFSPIVNAPEAAILGVSKAAMKPVWDGTAFQPRLIAPLSLTADHRIIDGALATRFNVHLAALLADFRRVTL
ncbi:MAG: dihydrolipoyllysine-residue acetyltransferase [Zoogloeaceae bacterium]|jgi:pyruvate dehydrogenase E2 component (dihydrolipoamide acetyltransferase)|nr:dihydrolipoyllysine-residue acetyltransferase [Zoogloeaceae bacterium]